MTIRYTYSPSPPPPAWTGDDENCNSPPPAPTRNMLIFMPTLFMPTDMRIRWLDHRVHTQSGNGHALSGVHSIMVKTAQPGEGLGGARLHALSLSLYLPSLAMLWCALQLRAQIYYLLFLLYPCMYSVIQTVTKPFWISMNCQFAHLSWHSLLCV